MLGTGNALVTECYNTCFVLEENEKYFSLAFGGILVKHYVCSDNVNNLFYYMTIKNKQAFVIGNVSNRASYN